MIRALHVFAGAGGSVLAGEMIGWQSVGCVEIDPFCCAVLKHNFGETVLANDITTWKADRLTGHVDVVVGGSPCQDLSVAGKRAGIGGTRSGLWFHQLRVAQECGAPFIFWENVRGVLSSNAGHDFGAILRSLAAAGYDARWIVNRASDVGAPHRRERVWLAAHAIRHGKPEGINGTEPGLFDPAGELTMGHAAGERSQRGPEDERARELLFGETGLGHQDRAPKPRLGGAADGLAGAFNWPAARGAWPAGRGAAQAPWEAPRVIDYRMPARISRLKALGNGWVPHQAAAAWRELTET